MADIGDAAAVGSKIKGLREQVANLPAGIAKVVIDRLCALGRESLTQCRPRRLVAKKFSAARLGKHLHQSGVISVKAKMNFWPFRIGPMSRCQVLARLSVPSLQMG